MRSKPFVIGTLAVLLGCAGVSKDQYKAKEMEAAKYKQSAQEQTDQIATLQQQVTSLEQQNKELQNKSQALGSQTESLQSQLHATSATAADLQGKRPVKINQPVLFKENSSKLTTEGKRSLDSIADALAGSKDRAILVSGFTDGAEAPGKSADANRWQLSANRALTVAKYLAGRGVDPTMISVAGFGQARPVASNDTLATRAQNRRVEIVLTPANQEVLTIDLKPAELMHQGTGSGSGEQQGQQQEQPQQPQQQP
ncbi:MAG: OmpA family protein [Anaeromyxobacter sp.]